MNKAIPELINLANGLTTYGDKLGAQICRDAITEIEQLREQIDAMHAAGLGPDWTHKTVRELRAEIERLQETIEELHQRLSFCHRVLERVASVEAVKWAVAEITQEG